MKQLKIIDTLEMYHQATVCSPILAQGPCMRGPNGLSYGVLRHPSAMASSLLKLITSPMALQNMSMIGFIQVVASTLALVMMSVSSAY